VAMVNANGRESGRVRPAPCAAPLVRVRSLVTAALLALSCTGCLTAITTTTTTAATTTAATTTTTGTRAVAAGERAQAKTLRVAITQEIDSLNPFLAFYLSSTSMLRLTYDYLTNYDPKTLRPSPGLATGWKVSDDKLTWTYTIRDNARWSDGRPVTARDIAFTYNLMLRDSDARTANGSYVAGFDSVRAEDDRTLVIKTKKPSATMLSVLVPIVPEHVWKGVKDIGNEQVTEFPVVGSGPFTIVEHKANQYVRLRANKGYWAGAPKVDELVFLQYKNTDAAAAALRGGEVDLVSQLTAAQFDSLKGAEGIVARRGQGRRFYQLAMNPGAATVGNKPIGDGHPALKDVRVRQAVHRAIDKKTLVDKVLAGYGEVGEGYVPPLFKDYRWRPAARERIDFNIGEANRTLDAAGYARGPDGVRRMPAGAPGRGQGAGQSAGQNAGQSNGRKLEFRLAAHASRSEDARLAEYIRGWLRQLGITVNVQVMEDNKLNESIAAGDYDLQLGGWSVNPDPDFVFSLQTCGQRPQDGGKGGTTDNFYCDPAYDGLYRQQAGELDPARRIQVAKQLQARLYAQSASVVLYYASALEAYAGDRFRYFQPMPDPGGLIYGQDGYWSFLTATPGGARAQPAGSGGPGALGWTAVAVAVAALAGGGLVVWRRRRAGVEDRE
jgi:peptide/nickel transport system substrate-binding protein